MPNKNELGAALSPDTSLLGLFFFALFSPLMVLGGMTKE